MATFEVETDLIIHCKVKIVVEANDTDGAIDAASELMPSNFERGAASGWKAKVDLRPPKGVNARVVRAYHFEQASGSDRAKRIGP